MNPDAHAPFRTNDPTHGSANILEAIPARSGVKTCLEKRVLRLTWHRKTLQSCEHLTYSVRMIKRNNWHSRHFYGQYTHVSNRTADLKRIDTHVGEQGGNVEGRASLWSHQREQLVRTGKVSTPTDSLRLAVQQRCRKEVAEVTHVTVHHWAAWNGLLNAGDTNRVHCTSYLRVITAARSHNFRKVAKSKGNPPGTPSRGMALRTVQEHSFLTWSAPCT